MATKNVATDSSTYSVEHVTPTEEELKTVPQRSYKCDLCGLQVKTLANLRIHRVKTHRIVESDSDVAVLYRTKRCVKKMFHCPVVGCKYQDPHQGFPKQSALRQHYIWVHGRRDHMCSSCFRLFPSLTLLERHKISCGQCHICVECGRRYSELKYLRQHLKRTKHASPEASLLSSISQAPVVHLDAIQGPSTSNSCINGAEEKVANVATSSKPELSQVHCLQPVILPVVIPIPMATSASAMISAPSFDPQALADAVSCAIRPVIERISVEAATQTTPENRPQTASVMPVAIPSSPATPLQLVEKAVHMDSNSFMNMSNFVDTGVTAIPTDLNLHPVGSQTDDLFANPYDRPCLHVETQTSDIFNHSMTCAPTRNLQTPQPPMAGTQTLDQAVVSAEYLSNMQTQTEPLEAWIDADFSDIETQTTDYDLDTLLGMTCSQTQTNV